MTCVFDWSQYGTTVAVFTLPKAATYLEVRSTGRHGERVELSDDAVRELVSALVGACGHPLADQLAATEQALVDVENERDHEREQRRIAEAELRDRILEAEALKTALHLADERARAAEALS